MRVLFSVTVWAIFPLYCYSAPTIVRSSQGSESDLISVAVLYRHGDKTPTTSFPNDPYFDVSYWPMGLGQLTKKGKIRQYELGQWLRNRYSAFLPEVYNARDIYVRSTDVDRTLMSAAANLAGLYPPKDSQVWNPNLLWQPIPVHTIKREEDQILYMDNNCPKFNRLYNDEYNATFFKGINEQYASFYREVSKLTGWDVNDVHFFAQLQSALYVYASYNASYLPAWADSVDQGKLEYLAGLNYARYTFTRQLKRLGAGPLFDYLISHFDKFVSGAANTPRFLMLSGHESTLAAALNTMDVFDYRAPAFASCIIWELRRDSRGMYFLNMFYKKNSTLDVPNSLKLKSCGLDCSYQNYKNIMAPITVNMTTWAKECLE